MADPPNVREALNTLMECINAKKKSKTHHLSYYEVKKMAEWEFEQLKKNNGEVDLIDGVYVVLRRDCPELFKEELASAPAPVPAPVPEAQPDIDEANLLLRLKRMQQLSDVEEKLKKGNPYKRVTDEARRQTYNESKERL